MFHRISLFEANSSIQKNVIAKKGHAVKGHTGFYFRRGDGGGGGDKSMFKRVNEAVRSSIDFPQVVPVFP